jgi:hypothetical protein
MIESNKGKFNKWSRFFKFHKFILLKKENPAFIVSRVWWVSTELDTIVSAVLNIEIMINKKYT